MESIHFDQHETGVFRLSMECFDTSRRGSGRSRARTYRLTGAVCERSEDLHYLWLVSVYLEDVDFVRHRYNCVLRSGNRTKFVRHDRSVFDSTSLVAHHCNSSGRGPGLY